MSKKYTNGAFVFCRARGLEPRTPEECRRIAEEHGVDPAVVPEYAGDRVALIRALKRVTTSISRDHILLRPIKRVGDALEFGIVSEVLDEESHKVTHTQLGVVSWTEEPDPSVVAGDHEVAVQVAEKYRELRGKVTADDWSQAIVGHLESLGATAMRSDGRVYWVPPQKIDEVKALRKLLDAVGVDTILCEVEPEVQTVVQDVARLSLDEELDALQQEVDGFDGTQKPTTYELRLVQYQALRERANLYKDALGIGVDKAKHVLDELEEKVRDMLDVRRTRVRRRDGSMTDKKVVVAVEAPVVAEAHTVPKRQALVIAGTRFEEVLETEEPRTNGTVVFCPRVTEIPQDVRTLLTTALARWTRVGPGKLRAVTVSNEVRLNLQGAGAEACKKGLALYGIVVG